MTLVTGVVPCGLFYLTCLITHIREQHDTSACRSACSSMHIYIIYNLSHSIYIQLLSYVHANDSNHNSSNFIGSDNQKKLFI